MIGLPRAFQPYIICRVWEDLKFFLHRSKQVCSIDFLEAKKDLQTIISKQREKFYYYFVMIYFMKP